MGKRPKLGEVWFGLVEEWGRYPTHVEVRRTGSKFVVVAIYDREFEIRLDFWNANFKLCSRQNGKPVRKVGDAFPRREAVRNAVKKR